MPGEGFVKGSDTAPVLFPVTAYGGYKRKLSHFPGDIPGRVRQGTTCGEWRGDNWRGREACVLLSEFPLISIQGQKPQVFAFSWGLQSVPALFLACKGAILALPVAANPCSWQQLGLVHREPCFCLQRAMPIPARDVYFLINCCPYLKRSVKDRPCTFNIVLIVPWWLPMHRNPIKVVWFSFSKYSQLSLMQL